MSRYEQISKDLITNPKTWLVTGAAGFIGSHLVERLLKLGQKVLAVDNLATGLKSNIEYLKKLKSANQLQVFIGDICDAKICKELTTETDYVLHQAAIGSVPRSIENPLHSHDSNVTGFINILHAATQAKVKRFVYASSSSVYGDSETLPKKEGDEGNLLSPYAATKAIDELYAKVFARVYKTHLVGLRYFNVFGPRQSPEGPYAAVIPLWIQAILDGKDVFINGDGSYSRDFCYIENVIQANLLAATCEDRALNHVYNIAYGDRTTLLQLFELIRGCLLELKPDLKILEAKKRDFRPGDIPHSLADISQAKALLGYLPKFSVKQGMQETVKAYLNL